MVVPDEGGDESSLVLVFAQGEHAEDLVGLRFGRDRSLSGEVMRTGQAIILEDASADKRAHQPMVRVGDMGPAMSHSQVLEWISGSFIQSH